MLDYIFSFHQKIFAAGDRWLMERGIITPIAHNNIVLNLYAATGVPYLEYFINPERKTLEVILYQKRWKLLFFGGKKIYNQAYQLLNEYLLDYTIRVHVDIFKKKKM
jgi:hypothetical protein